MRIGIDIDNTTLDYSESFRNQVHSVLGVDLGANSKSDIQAYVVEKHGGSVWTSLQGLVYSQNPLQAVLFDGFEEFVKRALGANAEITFVSHKTRYPIVGPKVDIRVPVVDLMRELLIPPVAGYEFPIYFCETFEEKVARIREFQFDYFVDDLAQVLAGVGRPTIGLHFSCQCVTVSALSHEPVSNWKDISNRIFEGK